MDARQRVSRACEGCKSSRRKCTGEQPCENCIKRGVECVFSDEPPKKRGPKKGSSRHAPAVATAALGASPDAALRAEFDRLRKAARAAGSSGGSSRAMSDVASTSAPSSSQASAALTAGMRSAAALPVAAAAAAAMAASSSDGSCGFIPTAVSSMQGRPAWETPTRIVPSPQEHALLRTFFETSNRILPAVDQDYFYAALEEAKYYEEASSSKPAAYASLPLSHGEHPFTSVERNSESFGFRVCYFTLLCAGARMEGRLRLAKQYYELARVYVGPCFAQPSQHLVSALLIMTVITRIVCQDAQQATCHAALALRMCDLVEVTPEIRMVAVVMNYAHGSHSHSWPPARVAMDVPTHIRFADILGFTVAQVVSDFPAIQSQADQEAMLSLLDEARQLQIVTRLFSKWPVVALTHAITAVLHRRFGHVVLCCEELQRALNEVEDEPLASYCFPFVVVVSRLVPGLSSAPAGVEIPAAIVDMAAAVRARACAFLRKNPSGCSTACGDAPAAAGGSDCIPPLPAASVCPGCSNGVCTCARTASAVAHAAAKIAGNEASSLVAEGATHSSFSQSTAPPTALIPAAVGGMDVDDTDEGCAVRPLYGPAATAAPAGTTAAGGKCSGAIPPMPTDIIGMLGYVVVTARCPVTGATYEKRVPVSEWTGTATATTTTAANSMASPLGVTTSSHTLPDGSLRIRTEGEYDNKRKAPASRLPASAIPAEASTGARGTLASFRSELDAAQPSLIPGLAAMSVASSDDVGLHLLADLTTAMSPGDAMWSIPVSKEDAAMRLAAMRGADTTFAVPLAGSRAVDGRSASTSTDTGSGAASSSVRTLHDALGAQISLADDVASRLPPPRRQPPLFTATPFVSRVDSFMDTAMKHPESSASPAGGVAPQVPGLDITLSPWPQDDELMTTLMQHAYGDLNFDSHEGTLPSPSDGGASSDGVHMTSTSSAPAPAEVSRETFRRNIARMLTSIFPAGAAAAGVTASEADGAAVAANAAAQVDDDNMSVTSLGLPLNVFDRFLP